MNPGLLSEVPIRSETDIVAVRKCVRQAATQLGFGVTDVTRIITAASELARNVFLYAGAGILRGRSLHESGHIGIELIVEDSGPGIPNLEQAMEPGYTTGGGLGLGLPGTKRLMDEMLVETQAGSGTKITIKKWQRDKEG